MRFPIEKMTCGGYARSVTKAVGSVDRRRRSMPIRSRKGNHRLGAASLLPCAR